MSELIKNKVAESGIITIDLEKFYPSEQVVTFDIKEYLFMGLILKEKDFREALKQLETEHYHQKIVAVTCTADAVIPMWAYMLIAATLNPICHFVMMGNEEEVKEKLLIQNIKKINPSDYADQRVVVKGCGEKPIPPEAYLEITNMLAAVVKSIMFGEPCSTVPIFKRKQ